jgi:ubiquinone/menaquinone biosynthesis C-methylase UbiE
MSSIINSLLAPAGLRLQRLSPRVLRPEEPPPPGHYARYISEAQAADLDINDWLETEMKWQRALPDLSQLIFPIIREDTVACEVGPGTGRHARHVIDKVARIYLADQSKWCCDFLTHYFLDQKNVDVLCCSGDNLPLPDAHCNFIMANGVFIIEQLRTFYTHAGEYYRVLKPGGHAILDFRNATTDAGWQMFLTKPDLTYHCNAAVERVFREAGFSAIQFWEPDHRTYLIAQK